MADEIKTGDAVVCVDDECSFNRLRNGNTYIVESNYDGSPAVFVNGTSHMIERFQKVDYENRKDRNTDNKRAKGQA